MLKPTCGGSDALNEMHLMMGEKINAAFESGANLMARASADSVVDRYRQHVAANAERLSIRWAPIPGTGETVAYCSCGVRFPLVRREPA